MLLEGRLVQSVIDLVVEIVVVTGAGGGVAVPRIVAAEVVTESLFSFELTRVILRKLDEVIGFRSFDAGAFRAVQEPGGQLQAEAQLMSTSKRELRIM